jgi:protein-cysteine N-palmitoyltransferase HHAT
MFIPPNSQIPKEFRYIELFIAIILGAGPATYGLIQAIYYSLELPPKTIHGLEKSNWNSNWYIDLTDFQLNAFRQNLLLMSSIAFVFVFIRKIIFFYTQDTKIRLYYYIMFGFFFVTYLHGLGIIIIVVIININYFLCIAAGKNKYFQLIVWGINFGLLVFSKISYSYFIESIHDLISFEPPLPWNFSYGLVMLKMMSFMIDYHWKITDKPSLSKQEHGLKCKECEKYAPCIKYRMQEHSDDYSLLAFIAYTFYCPLYLAGPTTTYNCWISQVKLPQTLISTKYIIIYAIRLLFMWILLEVLIHTSFYVAIVQLKDNSEIWKAFSPAQMIFASYCLITFIWLKFTFIWRYFRLWSMLDGVEPPENMGRCMSNNYCFIDFWKNWHRGFNLWLVRYLYIPLGGNRMKLLNIWVVFGFVALWHELNLNLLAWGWGMCLVIMPEVALMTYFSREKFKNLRQTLIYNYMCAMVAGLDVILMVSANLIGFCFGIEGMAILLEGLTILLLLKIYVVTILYVSCLRLIENFKFKHTKTA